MFADASTLAAMDPHTADNQDYGIIQVDDEGRVVHYNRWESEMAGVDPQWARGRNFFTEVAPCTNNRLIYGRFKKGVAAGELDIKCNYTFTYKMRPTNVKFGMVRDERTGRNFVLVSK